MPRPDRGVVDQQHPADLVATHPAIQQHQRVRPTGQTMFDRPVPSQLGQVLPFLRCQKAAANHGAEKNPSAPVWQAVFSTSHGVTVYPAKTTQMISEVQRLKAANPAVVMQSSYLGDAILAMKTYKELGFTPAMLLANDAGFNDTEFLTTLGKDAEYVMSREVWALDQAERNRLIRQV